MTRLPGGPEPPPEIPDRTDSTPEPGYPNPEFSLDALWNIYRVNYLAEYCGLQPGQNFFDIMFEYCRRLPKSSKAEIHTWEMEVVRALTYFESVIPRSEKERQTHPTLIDYPTLVNRLSAKLRDYKKSQTFANLRQIARSAMQALSEERAVVTFTDPVRICTLSLFCPFDRKLILRFNFVLRHFYPDPDDSSPPEPRERYRAMLLPQNDITAEALGILDHLRVDVIKKWVYHYDDFVHALVYMERHNPHRQESGQPGQPEESEEIARNPLKQQEVFSRRRHLEELAEKLREKGLQFERLPDHVYPGMDYVTPRGLIKSGLTNYSQNHLLLLVRQKILPAFQLANQVVFDAEGVQHLLDYEQESLAAGEHAGGRKPGPRSRKRKPARSAQTA